VEGYNAGIIKNKKNKKSNEKSNRKNKKSNEKSNRKNKKKAIPINPFVRGILA
jgi:hypothetical protein